MFLLLSLKFSFLLQHFNICLHFDTDLLVNIHPGLHQYTNSLFAFLFFIVAANLQKVVDSLPSSKSITFPLVSIVSSLCTMLRNPIIV